MLDMPTVKNKLKAYSKNGTVLITRLIQNMTKTAEMDRVTAGRFSKSK